MVVGTQYSLELGSRAEGDTPVEQGNLVAEGILVELGNLAEEDTRVDRHILDSIHERTQQCEGDGKNIHCTLETSYIFGPI